MTKTEIGFKAFETSTRLTRGKVCYQGRIQHTAVLSPAATRKAFAEFANLKPSMANLAVDSLCDFIADQLSQGHRVDFGGFSVSLTFKGGLKSANSPFSKEHNEISVNMLPGKTILSAVDKLKPVNVANEQQAKINSTEQVSPPVSGIDLLDADGDRRVVTCFSGQRLDLSSEGAGIWIESDAGEKLCEATDATYAGLTVSYSLSGPIAPGAHWVVLCGRAGNSREFLRIARRVQVR